ncbi:hypothetical protein [uncultured Idiomarina sp.]|uniref:hypothetical protein n=1 Tax=uncultured Idiomarina sp. TaxID=352961 RepID=UPI002596DFC9|nr:hypothetical protein [uncultured Idiomarina sp.]
MTKDDGEYLYACVNSIFRTVKSEICVFVVDNNSCDEAHLKILNEIECDFDVVVVRNKFNRWVLGLNEVLVRVKKEFCSKYFFITDGDIDFTDCLGDSCWLSYLIKQMEQDQRIAKIGFSLSWDYIERDPRFENILNQEKSLYNPKKKLGDLFISQVDTTATLFRWGWSMDASDCLYPHHIKYVRPELYSCRTPRHINVEHLGWRSYFSGSKDEKQITQKVICFTLIAGHLKDEVKRNSAFHARLFNTLLGRIFSSFWSLRRYIYAVRYNLKRIRHGYYGQTSSNDSIDK